MRKKMEKEIEIVIDGKVFTATLLWDRAPKTCRAVLGVLPLDHTTTIDGGAVHSSWAGDVIMARWPFDKLPLEVAPENQTIYLREGICTWKTYHIDDVHLNEIYICYRYGYGHAWWGSNPTNDFAKIGDKLDELAKVGEDIYMGGGRKTFTMRKKK